MRFSCPSCNQALLAQQFASETQVKCPFCGTNCTVPALGSLSAPGAVSQQQDPNAEGSPGGQNWGSAGNRELWTGFAIGAAISASFLLMMLTLVLSFLIADGCLSFWFSSSDGQRES